MAYAFETFLHSKGSSFYSKMTDCVSFCNVETGCFLAVHEDGTLVCKDKDPQHHVFPFTMTPAGENNEMDAFVA